MAFNIILGYTNDPVNRIDKTMTNTTVISGTLKHESDIRNPVIKINHEDKTFNYVYIPGFNRYYYVDEIRSIRTGLLEVSLRTDVLMTFAQQIIDTDLIIDRTGELSEANLYIDDDSQVVENRIVTKVYEFANGFDQNGEFILITAGG